MTPTLSAFNCRPVQSIRSCDADDCVPNRAFPVVRARSRAILPLVQVVNPILRPGVVTRFRSFGDRRTDRIVINATRRVSADEEIAAANVG